MSETLTQTNTEQQSQQAPFETLANSIWSDNGATEKPAELPKAEEQQQTPLKAESNLMEVNDWLKQEFEIDNLDTFKSQWNELRKLKEQPPKVEEIKFANEESKKAYEYLLEGKRSDLHKILDRQERLDRYEKLENPTTHEATEILRTHLQYKNQNLTPDQIDFLIEENYSKPSKPIQALDEAEEDFNDRLTEWKGQTDRIDKKLIIDSKIAQPELAKLKTEIVLPDIPKSAAAKIEATPEEVAELQSKQAFFAKSVDESLNSFSSLRVNYKDEAVELPINYEVSNEEKATVKTIVNGLYKSWDYFGQRWSNADGTLNTGMMAEDIYWIENRARVAQKFVNETGTQIKLAELRHRNNINIKDGSSSAGSLVPEKTSQQSQEEAIWGA